VQAAFYHVRSGRVDRLDGLPGRAELERLVSGAGQYSTVGRRKA
jgi:hypothetical protein